MRLSLHLFIVGMFEFKDSSHIIMNKEINLRRVLFFFRENDKKNFLNKSRMN